jgi:hypothetical protein
MATADKLPRSRLHDSDLRRRATTFSSRDKVGSSAESVGGLRLGEVAELVVKGYAQMLEIPVAKGFAHRVADSQVEPFYHPGVVLFFGAKIVHQQFFVRS